MTPHLPHTPGEWRAERASHNRNHYVVRVPEALICVVGNLGDTSDHAPTVKRWKAEAAINAALIAGSPALWALISEIAALQHESETEDGMSGDDAVDTLNSLISGARALVAEIAGDPCHEQLKTIGGE